jgi:ABC-type amino acid transport substrate-binding protein
VASTKTYFEINDQSLQVLQLLKERVDAVLSDVNIFKYYFFRANKNPHVNFSDFEIHCALKENSLELEKLFFQSRFGEKLNQTYFEGVNMITRKGALSADIGSGSPV